MKVRFAGALMMTGALAASGCAKQEFANPIKPSTAFARLEVSMSPDPVPFSGRASCSASFPRAWVPTVTIRETNGVGATIQSWEWTMYDSRGSMVDTENVIDFFARAFGNTHIGPNGSVSAQILDCEAASFTNGAIEMKFTGTDDSGLPVVGSARATLSR